METNGDNVSKKGLERPIVESGCAFFQLKMQSRQSLDPDIWDHWVALACPPYRQCCQEACEMVEKAGLSCAKVTSILPKLMISTLESTK